MGCLIELVFGIISELVSNWIDEYGWVTAFYMVWMIVWGLVLFGGLFYAGDDFWVPLIPMGVATVLWAIYDRFWR